VASFPFVYIARYVNALQGAVLDLKNTRAVAGALRLDEEGGAVVLQGVVRYGDEANPFLMKTYGLAPAEPLAAGCAPRGSVLAFSLGKDLREFWDQLGYEGDADARESFLKLQSEHGVLFDAVIDLAPGGVGEALWKGMRASGPHRMEAAGDMGIPQVIAPCSVNFMTPRKSQYKPDYYERRKVNLDKHRTWIRISPQEMEAVAKTFTEKLNRAKGPIRVVIPKRGWSAVDREGSPAYDPDGDAIFSNILKRELKEDIIVREVDTNLEDPEFAEVVVDAFRKITGA